MNAVFLLADRDWSLDDLRAGWIRSGLIVEDAEFDRLVVSDRGSSEHGYVGTVTELDYGLRTAFGDVALARLLEVEHRSLILLARVLGSIDQDRQMTVDTDHGFYGSLGPSRDDGRAARVGLAQRAVPSGCIATHWRSAASMSPSARIVRWRSSSPCPTAPSSRVRRTGRSSSPEPRVRDRLTLTSRWPCYRSSNWGRRPCLLMPQPDFRSHNCCRLLSPGRARPTDWPRLAVEWLAKTGVPDGLHDALAAFAHSDRGSQQTRHAARRLLRGAG